MNPTPLEDEGTNKRDIVTEVLLQTLAKAALVG